MYVYKELTRDNRRRGWDYTSAGVYFVTICADRLAPCLGRISGANVRLTPSGKIIQRTWFELPSRFRRVELDEFVVMPDHVHGILILQKPGGSRPAATTHSYLPQSNLSEIVRVFKSLSAFRINRMLDARGPIWERSFYDHMVRSGEALDRIRRYIAENPLRWCLEREKSNSNFGSKKTP